MKNIFTPLFLLISLSIFAQKEYFQQEVNYQISVTLNDIDHTLSGEVFIEYVNNSPDDLTEIHFNLWPNAYKNTETAFAKQQVRLGSTKFYFTEPKNYGSFTEIDFKAKNKSLEWSNLDGAEDMAVVKLDQPLKSGSSTEISIPFTLDIPASFSRLGHVEQSYQMTQWYPKPAVYDKNGWHAMPYLDMGEFYSEFGRYEVRITLPANYVVGATGTLKTESEKEFLNKKIEETNEWAKDYEPFKTKTAGQLRRRQSQADSIPPSSTEMKTIRYSAKNVHDFAWFADKRFRVQKGEVELNNGKKVETYAMFTMYEENLWLNAVKYLNRSVKFYSDHVGEYPYPHATAVQSALSAGGGMEYPMITVIGKSGDSISLDRVITHEVGHNWFYGILGTNERIHPWMDEGMNSYYENRYMREFYGSEKLDLDDIGIPKFITGETPYDAEQAAHLFQVCNHRAQAPDMDSDDMTRTNYGIGAYFKPALALRQMELSLGTERFDAAMQEYFQKWQFKHPDPEDYRKIINAEADTDIHWFIDDFMYATKEQNYKVKDILENSDTYTLTIENVGGVAAPFPLNGMSNDTTILETEWYEGFTGEKEVTFSKGTYNSIMLDGEFSTLETDHRDNKIKITGGKMRPLSLRLIGGIENPHKTYLAIAPIVAFNNYDKTILGFALHNWRLPERKFTYMLAPTIGTGSGDLGGLGHLSYRFQLGNNKKASSNPIIEIGSNMQSFSYDYNLGQEEHLAYQKIAPYLNIRFEKPQSNLFTDIMLRNTIIRSEFVDFTDTGSGFINENTRSFFEGIYQTEIRRKINPFSLRASIELGQRNIFGTDQNYVLPKLELNYAYTYARGKNINFRLFGGMVISDFGDRRIPGLLNLTGQGYSGYNDYKFEDWYFGRNDNEGLFSQQITMREGGFKVAIPAPFASNGFTSNKLLVALNLKADLPKELPLNLPVKPYFDMAYVGQPASDTEEITFSDQFWWNGGFALEFGQGIFGVYFPVVSSSNLQSFRTDYRSKYFNRVTFVLDLKKLNPRRIADRAAN